MFINGVEVTNLDLADGITHIRDYTFSGCHGLKSVVIPKSVKKIGSFSFNNCCEMTSVTIPDNVQAIESCAFADCTKLTSVTIPDSITTIESAVFYGCTSLNSVIIGKKVSSIGFEAFEGCKNLNTIKILPLTPPSVNDYSFDDYNKTLLVPEESLSLYTNTDPWKNFSTIIPYNDEGTTCIKATKEETLKIRTFNGIITVSNADEGELVSIYTTNGISVGTAIIRNGQAYVETHIKPGSIAIVKVGCKTMKIIMQ